MSRKKRIKGLPVFFSLTIVLFLLGVFILVSFFANKTIEELKGKLVIVVYFNSHISQDSCKQFFNEYKNNQFVKHAEFISSEEALLTMQNELGEDLKDVLGENVLPASIELTLKSEELNQNEIDNIIAELSRHPLIYEVVTQKNIIDTINRQKEIAMLVLAFLAVFFLVLAFILINSLIRLSMYSKRFIVKSMQLVGAKTSFIIKPFIKNSLIIAFFACITALSLSLLVYATIGTLLQKSQIISHFRLSDLWQKDLDIFVILVFTIFALGLLISYFGTLYTTKKYLKTKIDELY